MSELVNSELSKNLHLRGRSLTSEIYSFFHHYKSVTLSLRPTITQPATASLFLGAPTESFHFPPTGSSPPPPSPVSRLWGSHVLSSEFTDFINMLPSDGAQSPKTFCILIQIFFFILCVVIQKSRGKQVLTSPLCPNLHFQ